MQDDTIMQSSPIGQRLKNVGKKSMNCLLFNGQEIGLAKRTSIGRSRENNFVIDDRMVSRFHLEIQQIRGSYFVKDRESSNGTFINGKRINPNKYIKISKGDIIRLGSRIELTLA